MVSVFTIVRLFDFELFNVRFNDSNQNNLVTRLIFSPPENTVAKYLWYTQRVQLFFQL